MERRQQRTLVVPVAIHGGRAPSLAVLVTTMVALVVMALGRTGPAQAAETTYSIWPASVVPGVVTDPDTASTELGVRFRTSADGWVTAIRFYKSPSNTG